MFNISRSCAITLLVILPLLIFVSLLGVRQNIEITGSSSAQYIFSLDHVQSSNVDCNPGEPCKYPEIVDIRFIVIVYDRAVSVGKLLKSLDMIELDGDKGSIEIWIDRRKDGTVDNATLETALAFKWSKGPVRVHIQKRNVGIIGQWIDTWTPVDISPNSRELAVILEDDLTLSPYSYRWLKAAHRFYQQRPDYMGTTLQSDEVKSHDSSRINLLGPKNHTAFFYKCIGTWAFAPSPHHWRKFQKWFHTIARPDPTFHPYVPGIVPTSWFKSFEERGKADGMWTMWVIYYMYKEKMYNVYSNLATYNGDKKSCLVINRREVGLHYTSKGSESLCELLSYWKDEFSQFPSDPWKLDWNGKPQSKY